LEVSGAFVVLMEVYLREVIDERLGKKS
jgi:hypothetical protein